MKKVRIFLFIISLCLTNSICSQNAQKKATDTLPPAEKYGIRAGIDVAKIIRSSFDDDYSGFEIVADYRIYKNFYIATEFGNESLNRKEENITVKGAGNYINFGFDYNAYKNWYGMQNNIYFGLRYGYSNFDQNLVAYKIFTGTDYFGDTTRTEAIETTGLNAGWVSLLFGIKVEVLNNLYLGANISLKRMIHEKQPSGYDNLYIPGFGKTNDIGDYNVGYGYSISYMIPFFKRRK